jgi:hypothetical protein
MQSVKKLKIVSFITLNAILFSGCMTSSRQDALQASIDKLQDHITKIESKLSMHDNTAQSIIESQNETQNIKDQLQLTQGAVDEIKNRLKKIEENAGTANSSNVVTLNADSEAIATLQKQVARLQLATNSRFSYTRKAKLPANIKNAEELSKMLKSLFDAGKFKNMADIATSVLLAHDATDEMLGIALEFRGEARYQMQDYRGSASDLAGVLDAFSNPPRKARALLLAGDCYVYLKNNSIAQLYYQDCVKEFSSTPEGKAAASRLESLTAQMSSAAKSASVAK